MQMSVFLWFLQQVRKKGIEGNRPKMSYVNTMTISKKTLLISMIFHLIFVYDTIFLKIDIHVLRIKERIVGLDIISL